MNLDITGHHIDLTDALRDYVTEKLQRVERHFDHLIDAHVILTVEKLEKKAEAARTGWARHRPHRMAAARAAPPSRGCRQRGPRMAAASPA